MTRAHSLIMSQFIILLLCMPFTGYANTNNTTNPDIKDKFSKIIEGQQNEETQNSGNLPKLQSPFAPAGVNLNEKNQAIQQEAIKAYFLHNMESNRHQLNVFHWQLLSAKIIFIVVILLVSSGIYFAAVQFHHGLSSGKSAEQSTEIEASLQGIKVSSPILGVIILTISLAFFYLYLIYVYPVEFVHS